MMPTLRYRFPMLPQLTAPPETAEETAQAYVGWKLLEADATNSEILIGKPCAPAWSYTQSKHLLILYGEVALAWQRGSVVSTDARPTHKHGLLFTFVDKHHSAPPYITNRITHDAVTHG